MTIPNKTAKSQISFSEIVSKVSKGPNKTNIYFDNGELISLPPYLYVNKGETLKVIKETNQPISVYKIGISETDSVLNTIKLFPQYDVSETIVIAPHTINLRFRERTSSKDLESIKLLEQFHYRGNGLNKIVGRRTVLLAEAEGIGIIGYGVISATVLACKPRFELFGISFTEQMHSRLINQIARIPRVVVHPEFRGLGIGSKIAEHLVKYASEHWDIKGYKPVIVEVIASMTEYHKFFEAAGFINAGFTAGKSTIFKPVYGKGEWGARSNSGNYKFFGPLGSKPYLIFPLTEKVKRLVAEKGFSNPILIEKSETTTQVSPVIEFKDISVAYVTENISTERSDSVRSIFGVNDNQLSSPILHNLNLIVEQGDVVLTTGASGSGKSTLLKLLTLNKVKSSNHIQINGTISIPQQNKIATLPSKWNNELPLVDQIGGNLKDSIAILNSVGLAEAHIYLKTPSQISEGQRYRFAIAFLCNSGKPIWIADEFASTLDPYTAAIVSKGIRKQAMKNGATLLVAAPHISNFVQSLLPTQIIKLQWGGVARIYAIKLRCDQIENKIHFTITNRTKISLTEIKFVVKSFQGDIKKLAYFPELKGKQQITDTYELPKSSGNGTGRILELTTAEGVGDIFYF